jgi:stage V sporulation protein B
MTIASNLFTSILNLRRLLKITSIPFELRKWLIRPAVAAMASGQITLLLYRYELFGSYIPQRVSLFVGITLACAAYTVLLFLLDCINPEDFEWMMRRIRGSSKQPKEATREVYD